MAGGGFLSCIVARSILRKSSLKSRLHDGLGFTHRPLSSSFWGLPYRVLNINHKKELLRGLWLMGRDVSGFRSLGRRLCPKLTFRNASFCQICCPRI